MRGGVAAIVPAAGAGARVGSPAGKLFLPLGGTPLLAHTLGALQASRAIRWIVIAARPDDRARIQALIRSYRITKALPPVAGGRSRAESVARAFTAAPGEADSILVHDGARPCVSPSLIEAAVREGARHGAVACGLPAMLTVKAADDGRRVRVTLDRTHLWFVQTPQVFRRDWFAQALERAGLIHGAETNPSARPDGLAQDFARQHTAGGFNGAAVDPDRFPDDAALLEAAGFPVTMAPGDALNIKVTTKEDFVLAEAILAARAAREVKTQKAKVKTTRQNSKVGAERFAVGGHF